MNLLLLSPEELHADGIATLTGRRAFHASEVLGKGVGETLRVGVREGLRGSAVILASSPEALTLSVTLDATPPTRPGLDILLALPRPKVLKRVLPALAAVGVDTVVLVNAARVEKSYFCSRMLVPEALDAELCAGLEQGQDTCAPRVLVRGRFRAFVEEELDGLFPGAERLLAHPTATASLAEVAAPGRLRSVIAIGPEGGWVPFELELLAAHGFVPFSLGERTLRVETVVPFVLGQLMGLRSPR